MLFGFGNKRMYYSARINLDSTMNDNINKKHFHKSSISHIELNPRTFPDYCKPNGWLDPCMACQALFYYYLLARKTYEETILDPIVLEGDKDPEFSFSGLWTGIAKLYNVQPHEMARWWINVDMQCDVIPTPRMPAGDQFRFDKVPEIISENDNA